VEIAAEEARAALRVERLALLVELAEAVTLDGEAAITTACANIRERWDALDRLPEAEQTALAREYAALSDQAGSRCDALRAQRKGNGRLTKLTAAAEQLLAQAKSLDHKEVQRLIEQAGPSLTTEGVAPALCDGFQLRRKELEARLAKQRKHATQRLQELPERVAELETHLAAGELKSAEPLLQSLQATVDLAEMSGLPRDAYARLGERLHALAPRVRELQNWRRWGTDQHRQGLQEAMEALETADIPLEAVTLRLHDLQAEWKDLDKGGGVPVNHALWERFHAASQRVYERCRPYLEEQARELEGNRLQRDQVCQDLEEFLDKADWARMDWKRAARAERETRQAWAALGAVEPRKRRALEKRFRAALARLDDRLEAERASNRRLKEGLIAQVDALVAHPDLEQAVEQTKHLQRQWHTSVPGRQREENRLWSRFRAACDAVFARRTEQQEAHQAELAANLAAREAICAEAIALSQGDDTPQDLASGLRDLDARWRTAEGLAVPRQASSSLAQRWREAREKLIAAQRERLAAVERRQHDVLASQAALCQRLEQIVLDGVVDETIVDAIAAEWDALGHNGDPAMQKAMAQRFDTALQAARAGGEVRGALLAAAEPNRRQRHALCLQLEILAQVDSPPELAKERMELQVARLSGRMAAGARDPLAGAAKLVRDWYLCGPAPADPDIEARFERARVALAQAETGRA
jgi:hypothetical protein